MAKLVIIGGGPSGMLASLSASKSLHHNHQVLLIERNDRLGKKILASGNGRCNFTNLNNDETFYNEPNFAKQVLDQFNHKQVRDFFDYLGVLQISDNEGRCYPYTYIASTILDALRYEIESKSNIDVLTGTKVESITKKDNHYLLKLNNNKLIKASAIIIANGGTSYASLGSDGSGHSLARELNHTITRLYPAITSIKVKEKDFKSLSGIRVNALVSLFNMDTDELIVSNKGEVLFKEDSISGIVSFIVSSFIARGFKNEPSMKFYLKLDLLEHLTFNDVLSLLEDKQKKTQELKLEHFLNGIVVRMLGISILNRSNIDFKDRLVKDLSKTELIKIASTLKNFTVRVNGLSPFTNAQTTCGGVSLVEINPKTLESKINKGLFFSGEVMDIDGECGGHNLQWAFSSGFVSGKYAADLLNERDDESL